MRISIKIGKKDRRNLLRKKNVVGVGVGHRQKKGKRTDEKAVLVFVTKKLAPRQLARSELAPRVLRGKRVDVVEIGEIRFMESCAPLGESFSGGDRLIRWRPAPGGVSIGHYHTTAGTLGAVVKEAATGERFILSNNHVLANSSSGTDGRASAGDPVLQPGSYDGGRVENDILARLERFIPLHSAYEPPGCAAALFWERLLNRFLQLLWPRYRLFLQKAAGEGNLVDAALARPLREEELSLELLGLGRVCGTGDVCPGDKVAFSGRTSGVVRGTVIARDVSLFITMEPGQEIYFVDQLITSAVSRPGDSGSLLLDEKNRAVGLLFAGSETVSVCNRLENVSRLLGVEPEIGSDSESGLAQIATGILRWKKQ